MDAIYTAKSRLMNYSCHNLTQQATLHLNIRKTFLATGAYFRSFNNKNLLYYYIITIMVATLLVFISQMGKYICFFFHPNKSAIKIFNKYLFVISDLNKIILCGVHIHKLPTQTSDRIFEYLRPRINKLQK